MKNDDIREHWVNTLLDLGFRARNGATAGKLIRAAELVFEEFEDELEHNDEKYKKRYSEISESLSLEVSEHQNTKDRSHRDVLGLKEDVKKLETELTEIKTLKVKSHVEDSDVEFVFSPRSSVSKDHRDQYFSIEHLEEILMYLRMNGATDETAVGINSNGIESIVKGVGYVLPNKRHETAVSEKTEEPGVLYRAYKKITRSGPLVLISSGVGGSIILVGLKLLGVL